MAAADSGSSFNSSCKIMTFRPTMEEFKDFNKYLVYMESQGAHRGGLAKVIPPVGWKPRKHYDDIDDLLIPAPIQQMVTGQSGLFTQYNIQKKPMTVGEFRQLANSYKYCTPRCMDYEDLERKYWKNLTFVAPIYGADVNGSLYNEDVDEWNITRLNTVLDVIGEECGISIEGVNTPYLYFGMWKTTFAWHTEDMDLYSINYLHFGEPKSWYAIPPEHGKRLERLSKGFFPSSSQGCDAFLRHKMTLISPSVLKKYGIPFDKCTCSKDMVKISMDIFVKKFQPDRYHLWKQGKDIYTIDHTKPTPESTPELRAWLQKRKKTRRLSKGLQHTRSRSKKRRTPEDRRVSSVPVAVDTKADEAVTDGFKVKEEPKRMDEQMEPTKIAMLSSGEESISKIQHEHNLLDNIQFSAECEQNNNDKEITDSCIPSCCFGEMEVSQNLSNNSVHEDSQKSPDKTENLDNQSVSYQKSDECITFETEALGKEETHSISIEEHSDCESQENGLEPGEILSFPDQLVIGESKKRAKSWRHPLTNPPATSPKTVVQQGVTSKKELLDIPLVEEEVHESEPWAKPLIHLWQNKVHSFLAEKEYNVAAARMEPYCAICTLFMPYFQTEKEEETASSMEKKTTTTPLAEVYKTKPLIPEMCFVNSEDNGKPCPPNALIEEDGTSRLIACSKCCVQVHASCYGVPSHEIHSDWMCSRCIIGALTADCCLCNLRGGALKQTTDNKWAHVMCALAVPEVRFVVVTERTPIDVSRISLQRLKLKCIFCRKRIKKVSRPCVQCSYGRCPTSFHVTCAHAAGVVMEPDDWPYVVYITCSRHKINQSVAKNSCVKNIAVGDTVISKHRNRRYYSCRVTQVTSQTFYELLFDDGSFSRDTYPEDIISRDCLQLGPPAVGEVVQVKWPDGLQYRAEYLGSNVVHMYQVEFEDGSQLIINREDIFTLDEELPKKVKARLSTASDMRFEDTFYGDEVIEGEKKRQRVPCSRFQNEYVGDPSYHSFLKSCFRNQCQKGQ
ncbi:lysine-specific demethylase 4C isoform X2 [Latimeria chalumnae]|uniref:lysine-specific demethylase 4C isoform X2 n=1 Tax=Latimeria chalumnae TaxID=7897 RepID=UPI00313DAD81